MEKTILRARLLASATSGTLVAAMLMVANAAHAQTTPPAAAPEAQDTTPAGANEGQVDDIIVTAQRRETRLQDTPIAITAISGDALNKAGANRIEDIARSVPGLTIPNASLNGNAAVSIRGINFYSGITAVSYPVAFYIDGLFIDRPYNIRDQMFDIARVEVLRGPQGVQFGRNATAGAIQIIHNLPTNDWRALARAEGGSFGTYRFQASVRGPLIADRIQIGLSGQYSHSDGYAYNDTLGRKIYGEDSKGVRGVIRLLPTKDLEVILRGSYSKNYNSNGLKNIVSFGTAFYPALLNDPAYAPFHLGNDYIGFTSRTGYDYSIETRYSAGPLEFVNLTGWQGFRQHSKADSDGNPTLRSQNQQNNVNYSSFSTEFRASTTGDGPAKLDLGVYYIREHPNEFNNDVRLYSLVNGVYVRNGGTYFRQNEVLAESMAVFAHLTYRIVDGLTFRIGARYSDEQKRFMVDFDVYSATGITRTLSNARQSFSSLTPTFGLDYKLNSTTLTYVTVSKGFKSGGFNLSPVTPFAPETVWNYEAGIKTDLFNRTLRFNLAAFYMDYRNIQVSKNTGNGLALIQNAATSTIKGVEVESEWRPIPRLTFSGSLAYLDARYDKFILDDRNPTGTNIGGAVLNRAPKWKGSLAADYDQPLGSVTLGLRAAFSYESSIYFESLLPAARLAYQRPSIINLDLRVGVRTKDDRFEVAGVVRNATNERYFGNIQNLLGGLNRAGYFAPPRYVGGEVTFKY